MKGKKHAPQREFRVLSRYNSENSIKPDEWEYPDTKGNTPDYQDKPFVFLDIDTGDLIDRIILAPRADEDIRDEVKNILSDNRLDIPIVESQISKGPKLSEAHSSEVQVASQRIDRKPEFGTQEWFSYHNDTIGKWVEETDFSDLHTVDAITRVWDRYAVQECYKYPERDRDIDLHDYIHEYVPYYFNGHRFIDSDFEYNIENNGLEKVREANRDTN